MDKGILLVSEGYEKDGKLAMLVIDSVLEQDKVRTVILENPYNIAPGNIVLYTYNPEIYLDLKEKAHILMPGGYDLRAAINYTKMLLSKEDNSVPK